MLSLIHLYYAFFIALFAVIFNEYLIQEGSIFGFYGKLLAKLPEWLASPLGDCSYCFGGQVALWGFFLIQWKYYFLRYDPVTHIFFIILTIFFVHIINKIWSILYD